MNSNQQFILHVESGSFRAGKSKNMSELKLLPYSETKSRKGSEDAPIIDLDGVVYFQAKEYGQVPINMLQLVIAQPCEVCGGEWSTSITDEVGDECSHCTEGFTYTIYKESKCESCQSDSSFQTCKHPDCNGTVDLTKEIVEALSVEKASIEICPNRHDYWNQQRKHENAQSYLENELTKLK